ncbi:DUF1934 domain-containing protein [Vagococcus sp. DIV0080]|uniref:DUF1934 domain-containing protein n=1 Tax=Candidatus Vagococcus giribetii TaxID=2230876 RepID=A0ABS3HRM8_9ENTE|nr:DUF1934 domain-containing protein [Vagococcus sp. DIV0080]MBO0476385.1 DUF1934 domain-containing protein [Vagococcus sp. DIV0080]
MEERKSIPVMIKLKTEVFQENEFKEFFLEEEGQIVRIGEVLYIRYKELLDGVDNKVSVTMKILADGSVQLIRAGEVRMKLKFDYQKYNETNYQTPFGNMIIRTFTNNIRVSLKDRPYSGQVTIDYDLYGGEEKIGVYHLELNFTA